MPNIDKIDAQLLAMLQENGRRSQHDLAKAVGLSAPAVGERLRKLEERGIIRQYTAVLDSKKLGQDITAYISVGINGSRYYSEFRKRVEDLPEILECHSVTGQGSHLLKIRVENTAAMEDLLAQLQSWSGVQWTSTSIVLSTIKETSSIALPSLDEDSSRDGVNPGDLLHVPFRRHS